MGLRPPPSARRAGGGAVLQAAADDVAALAVELAGAGLPDDVAHGALAAALRAAASARAHHLEEVAPLSAPRAPPSPWDDRVAHVSMDSGASAHGGSAPRAALTGGVLAIGVVSHAHITTFTSAAEYECAAWLTATVAAADAVSAALQRDVTAGPAAPMTPAVPSSRGVTRAALRPPGATRDVTLFLPADESAPYFRTKSWADVVRDRAAQYGRAWRAGPPFAPNLPSPVAAWGAFAVEGAADPLLTLTTRSVETLVVAVGAAVRAGRPALAAGGRVLLALEDPTMLPRGQASRDVEWLPMDGLVSIADLAMGAWYDEAAAEAPLRAVSFEGWRPAAAAAVGEAEDDDDLLEEDDVGAFMRREFGGAPAVDSDDGGVDVRRSVPMLSPDEIPLLPPRNGRPPSRFALFAPPRDVPLDDAGSDDDGRAGYRAVGAAPDVGALLLMPQPRSSVRARAPVAGKFRTREQVEEARAAAAADAARDVTPHPAAEREPPRQRRRVAAAPAAPPRPPSSDEEKDDGEEGRKRRRRDAAVDKRATAISRAAKATHAAVRLAFPGQPTYPSYGPPAKPVIFSADEAVAAAAALAAAHPPLPPPPRPAPPPPPPPLRRAPPELRPPRVALDYPRGPPIARTRAWRVDLVSDRGLPAAYTWRWERGMTLEAAKSLAPTPAAVLEELEGAMRDFGATPRALYGYLLDLLLVLRACSFWLARAQERGLVNARSVTDEIAPGDARRVRIEAASDAAGPRNRTPVTDDLAEWLVAAQFTYFKAAPDIQLQATRRMFADRVRTLGVRVHNMGLTARAPWGT